MQQRWNISPLDCDMWQKVDFIWQPATSSSAAGLRSSSKALPKAKLAPKKAWSPFSGLLLGLIHYSFLNPDEAIRSEKCAQQADTCNTYSQHWSTERPSSSPWQCQLYTAQPPCQKVNKLGYEALPHPPYSPDANRLPLLQVSWQLFAVKRLPQPAEYRKCFPRVHRILKHRCLCYRNKQTFLGGKNVLIVVVPTLINKAVFEPTVALETNPVEGFGSLDHLQSDNGVLFITSQSTVGW